MAKCFYTNLDKLERDSYNRKVVEEHQIHKTDTSTNTNVFEKYSMPPLFPKEPFKYKKKSRSVSRAKPKPGSKTPDSLWSTTLRTQCTVEPVMTGSGKVDLNPKGTRALQFTAESQNFLEKANSCPGRTCCCNRAIKSLNSQSAQQMTHYCPTNRPDERRAFYSCQNVALQLSGEMEKVKHHLHHLSQCKNEALTITNALKTSYIDLMENKKGVLQEIADLRKEKEYLKQQLQKCHKERDVNNTRYNIAKDILNTYEEKVTLLHDQAVKSSRIINKTKDKFCKLLLKKDEQIEKLVDKTANLENSIHDKTLQYEELSENYENLQAQLDHSDEKNNTLAENNADLCDCVKKCDYELKESIKEKERCQKHIEELETEIEDMKNIMTIQESQSDNYQKLQEKYESVMKDFIEREKELKQQVSDFKMTIASFESDNHQCDCAFRLLQKEYDELQEKHNTVQSKLKEYEDCASRCKLVEEECKQKCEISLGNEKLLQKERDEMKNLVEELTNVVKENRVTIMELSKCNKEQEALIESQSTALILKDEQIQMVVSEIEMFRKRSVELEQEVENLKQNSIAPCNNDTCTFFVEVEDLKVALNEVKDNHLIKEKIIEDQSKTILDLQHQIREKISELNRAQDQAQMADDEVVRINNELVMKHHQLEKEYSEKESLVQKLHRLEIEKCELSYQMENLEDMLDNYNNCCESCDETQQEALQNLQLQFEEQKREWCMQKQFMDEEKEKAIYSAKFATQKLLETVADFQEQVSAQKHVQQMLTAMLRDKDLQLKVVKSKIMSSITAITHAAREELLGESKVTKELYRSNLFKKSSPIIPQSSSYSTCSECSQKNDITNTISNKGLQDILEMLREDCPIN